MQEQYRLVPKSVDMVAQSIASLCNKMNITSRDALKYRLSAEEVINCWMEKGSAEYFDVKIGTRLGIPYITLSMADVEINPFVTTDDDVIVKRITDIMMRAPIFTYHHGVNTVTLEMKRKRMNSILKLFIYIAVSVCAGVLLKSFCPENIVSSLLNEIIEPVYSAFMRMIGLIAAPLIFLSVVWGIYSIGDISTMERIGKRLILSIIAVIVVGTIVFIPTLYLFGLKISSGGADSSVGSILGLITDIVPSNIASPFVDGNTLQIIFLAIIMGIAMLFFAKRVNALGEIVAQGNYVTQLIMETVSRFIPLLVFLIVLRVILHNMLGSILSSWFLVAMLLASFMLEKIVFTLLTAARCKVSPMLLAKKLMPLYIMALTTASSAACMNLCFETGEKKLGVEKSFCNFAVPICNVLLKITTMSLYLFTIFFFAKESGVQCSVGWIFTAALLTIFLSLATPSIAGGSVVAFTLLLSRMGLPDTALAVIIPLNTLMDFFFTSTNLYCNQMLMLLNASKLNLVNYGILRKK